MKRFIKNILPPFFFNFLNNSYIKFNKQKQLYSVDRYDNDLIANVIIKKTTIFKDNLTKSYGLDFTGLRTIIGISIAGLDLKKKELNVLDFGGGGGYHYFISKLILNDDINLKWHVVETKSIVKISNILSNNELHFFNSIEEASISPNRFDLIIASSSIQYCINQGKILQELIDLNSRNIFITRTPFSLDKPVYNNVQFSKLSNNGPGALPAGFTDCLISYPIFIMNIIDFENKFIDKYNLKFKILEEKNGFNIDNVNFDNYGFFWVNKNL
jgi:putative methyltransferase (TIGR04325 family)